MVVVASEARLHVAEQAADEADVERLHWITGAGCTYSKISSLVAQKSSSEQMIRGMLCRKTVASQTSGTYRYCPTYKRSTILAQAILAQGHFIQNRM